MRPHFVAKEDSPKSPLQYVQDNSFSKNKNKKELIHLNSIIYIFKIMYIIQLN